MLWRKKNNKADNIIDIYYGDMNEVNEIKDVIVAKPKKQKTLTFDNQQKSKKQESCRLIVSGSTVRGLYENGDANKIRRKVLKSIISDYFDGKLMTNDFVSGTSPTGFTACYKLRKFDNLTEKEEKCVKDHAFVNALKTLNKNGMLDKSKFLRALKSGKFGEGSHGNVTGNEGRPTEKAKPAMPKHLRRQYSKILRDLKSALTDLVRSNGTCREGRSGSGSTEDRINGLKARFTRFGAALKAESLTMPTKLEDYYESVIGVWDWLNTPVDGSIATSLRPDLGWNDYGRGPRWLFARTLFECGPVTLDIAVDGAKGDSAVDGKKGGTDDARVLRTDDVLPSIWPVAAVCARDDVSGKYGLAAVDAIVAAWDERLGEIQRYHDSGINSMGRSAAAPDLRASGEVPTYVTGPGEAWSGATDGSGDPACGQVTGDGAGIGIASMGQSGAAPDLRADGWVPGCVSGPGETERGTPDVSGAPSCGVIAEGGEVPACRTAPVGTTGSGAEDGLQEFKDMLRAFSAWFDKNMPVDEAGWKSADRARIKGVVESLDRCASAAIVWCDDRSKFLVKEVQKDASDLLWVLGNWKDQLLTGGEQRCASSAAFNADCFIRRLRVLPAALVSSYSQGS